MPKIEANGLSFEYEEMGDKGASPMVLVMGLGAQLIRWPDAFCKILADSGFRVIRFDNRDIGLSQKMDGAPLPDFGAIAQVMAKGEKPDVPYTLFEMAEDTVAIMEALDASPAHIVGASMGGMIVQLTAALHGPHVRSLTSIMSSTLNPNLPPATPEATAALLARPASTSREDVVALAVKNQKVVGSPGFPVPDETLREQHGSYFDRCYYPEGFARQYAAVLGTGNFGPLLGSVICPTLVIHGNDDPLVPVEGGKDTARHILQAEMELIDGMGHDLPPGLHERIARRIAEFAKQSDRAQVPNSGTGGPAF